MEICAQRSVGILPAHTLRPATPERRIAATTLATFSGSLGGCLRKSGISAATSVAVRPRTARAGRMPTLPWRSRYCGIGVLKSRGKARLGSDRVLKNSFSEARCLTFANFVNFCSNFLCFLLFRFFLRAFCQSVRTVAQKRASL